MGGSGLRRARGRHEALPDRSRVGREAQGAEQETIAGGEESAAGGPRPSRQLVERGTRPGNGAGDSRAHRRGRWRTGDGVVLERVADESEANRRDLETARPEG